MTTRATLFAFLLAACGGSQNPQPVPLPEPEPSPSPEPVTSEPAPPPEPVEPPPPAPPPTPEPQVAAPDVYKVLLENDSVRVFEVTAAPGAKVPMHKHPDHVAYVVTPGKLKMSGPTGDPQEVEFKAGQAVVIPASEHAVENVGTTEVKAIVVELRKPGTPAPEGKDPVKVAPKMHKVALDHEKVRVVEVTFKKKQKMAAHVHPDHVIVAMVAGKLKVKPADGEAKELELAPMTAMFAPATSHAAENVGGTELKAIVFELK